MNSKRVFVYVFLPIFVLILIVGEARIMSEGLSSTFLAQGVVVFGLYGAVVAAIIGGIAAGIHSIYSRRKKPRTSPAPPPVNQPAP
jgi:hypothetical protein